MTKLRLSNHRLAIETGCYMRPYKKPNERICPLCKKEAEDEKHFLVSCLGYQEKWKSLFKCLSTEFKIPIRKMSTENIFLLLLNPQVIILSYRKQSQSICMNVIKLEKNIGNSQLRLENYRICKFIWNKFVNVPCTRHQIKYVCM